MNPLCTCIRCTIYDVHCTSIDTEFRAQNYRKSWTNILIYWKIQFTKRKSIGSNVDVLYIMWECGYLCTYKRSKASILCVSTGNGNKIGSNISTIVPIQNAWLYKFVNRKPHPKHERALFQSIFIFSFFSFASFTLSSIMEIELRRGNINVKRLSIK